MNGHENNLLSILKSADKLIIPVYQRNYDWKEEQCKTLYDDLARTIQKKRRTHFFGGIVSVSDPDGGWSDLLIIDGQQRLTTVTLLLLALVNLLKEGKLSSQEENLADTIMKKFLVDESNSRNRKVKLKPIKGDSEAYDRLWGDVQDFNRNSNVTLNYLYFYNRIQRGELTADQLFEAVQRLQVIDITLKLPDDDPQLVFESLNSTGLDLNEGDKIRNYILMGLPTNTQEIYYEKYWNPIERFAGYDKQSNRYDVSLFIRDYLSIKQKKQSSIHTIYIRFKEYAEANYAQDIAPLLQDLLEYARRYHKLLEGSPEFPNKLNASIERLNRLGSNASRPFLTEVLREYEKEQLSSAEVTEIFRIVEAYLFRRMICDLPSNTLTKVFLSLAHDINRLDEKNIQYVDKMKFLLASRKEKSRFPDDNEFSKGLFEKNIYKMTSRYKAYLFERLENGDSLENKSIYAHLDSGNYTIEHIMPQILSPEWEKELGEDFEEIHSTWLHRLANLTLMAYNPSYSNRSFSEKCLMKNGFAESGIKMNQYIAKQRHWRLHELEERTEVLTSQALELWQYPYTSYTPPAKQLDEYALDEDISFTNRVIIKYRFKGIEQTVTNWVDLYISVLQILHQSNKTILNYLADAEESVELATHISHAETAFYKSGKIDDELYVYTNTSTQHKINLLLKFFALYGEDPENLILFVKENNATLSKTSLESHSLESENL